MPSSASFIKSAATAALVFSLFALLFIASPSAKAQQGDFDPDEQTSACTDLQNNLRYRSSDARTNGEVSLLQGFLQSLQYLNSEPTGFFGQMTLSAVKNFQQNNGFSPTGFVGPLTRAKIKELSCGGSSNPPTLDFSITPTRLTEGDQYTIFWSSTGATSCIWRSVSSKGRVDESQTGTHSETRGTIADDEIEDLGVGDSTFTLICKGPGGSVEKSVVLTLYRGTPTTSSITVTQPNGGEQWELGTTNTVTWTPYSYNPDVNPSRDVTAYLEYLSDGRFVTVGKVEESGKASIHWVTGQLYAASQSSNFASPGEYYIRVVNNKNAASDRSDRPFTILPKSVDLKLNGSDGPITVSGGENILAQWTSTGTSYCNMSGAKLESDNGSTYVINNIKTSGSAYVDVPSGGNAVFIECFKQVSGDRVYDTVIVNAPSVASLQVASPNGGEAIDAAKEWDIKTVITGLKTLSIALYKNDQWYGWLAKDMNAADRSANFEWIHREIAVASTFPELKNGSSAIFKIYATGQKADGTGYVDDKSDAAFSFTSGGKSPYTLSIAYVSGLKKEYASGTNISLTVKGTESDGTAGTPDEGYNVQTYLRGSNDSYNMQGVNATYNPQTGYWNAELTAPTDASKSYIVESAFYCSNRSLVCGERFTSGNGQVESSFSFAVTTSAPDTTFKLNPIKTDNNAALVPGQSYTITWESGKDNKDELLQFSIGAVNAPRGSGAYLLGQAYLSQKSYTFTVPTSITTSGDYFISANNTSVSLYANSPTFGVVVPATSAPTVSLIASPGAVSEGGSITLRWSSENATSCTASGSWEGTLSSAGTRTIGNVQRNSDSRFVYTATCTGPGGQQSATATVNMSPPSTLTTTASISASPTTVPSGGSATISWSSTNAKECSLVGPSGYILSMSQDQSKISSGSLSTGPLTSNVTYSFGCSDFYTGTGWKDATVTVTPASASGGGSGGVGVVTASPTASLTINGAHEGGGGTLKWASSGADTFVSTYSSDCRGSGLWDIKTASGSETVSAYECAMTITYKVTNSKTGASAFDSVKILPSADSGGGSGSDGGLLDPSANVAAASAALLPREPVPALVGAVNNLLKSQRRHAFETDLHRGMSGSEVQALQETLAAEGYFTGESTGHFYDVTREAVMAFQRKHNIPATGYVGPATRAALNGLR